MKYRLHVSQSDQQGYIRDDDELNWCPFNESIFDFDRIIEIIRYIVEHVEAQTKFTIIPIPDWLMKIE